MKDFILLVATIIGATAIIVVLLGYPLMLLWNWLIPPIFNLPEITFWQAIGLNLLSSILFRNTTNTSNKNNT